MAPCFSRHYSLCFEHSCDHRCKPQVSAKIAAAVAKNVFATGRNAGGAAEKAPADLLAACKAAMYFPEY